MTQSLFTQDQVDQMVAQAVANTREACAQLADQEPEPEGPLPEEFKGKGEEYMCRLGVIATKRNIAASIRAMGVQS
jgi:hypothetical protein